MKKMERNFLHKQLTLKCHEKRKEKKIQIIKSQSIMQKIWKSPYMCCIHPTKSITSWK